ncbi:MAG: hypothetical protein CBC27_08955 [Opitutia bacterium TMED67]|nr:aspartate aminotransferase family protein [Verrucomicrobiales bacterium]OUU70277.1 MAG: hypothetical protein CBC27_08955 [Opitutae bacterium TMED67]|tara:strand:+ start:656 stop:1963 length:1308 start_codon:yes stop_codon:yes gene_type:complete
MTLKGQKYLINIEMIHRAKNLFPGISNGEFGIIDESSVPIIQSGDGARVWDSNGKAYIDMTMAWGSVLIGHANPVIREAAFNAAKNGTNFAALNTQMVELGDQIASISPCVEKIRFVASGTEATMLCLRLARSVSGKSKILKFEGAYHGQHPEGIASMVQLNDRSSTKANTSGTGAPWVKESVLVAPFNDLEATRALIKENAADLAAVIVEPLHRCLKPVDGFLSGLRKITQELGIILVFDEVVTGFRLALGGAQEYYGVKPDLVAYGKALGGGFPIGAFGGSEEIMEGVNESRYSKLNYSWSASTTGGNPVSCAAAMATIKLLSEQQNFEKLHRLGREFRKQLTEILVNNEEPFQVLGDGPLAQVVFTDRTINNSRDWGVADRNKGLLLMLQLIKEGVFLNPMGTKMYLSLSHGAKEMEEFSDKFSSALKSLNS